MPAGQPFTQLCQTLARPRHFGRVDLHLHTTMSDGLYTPAQIVDLARRSGLSAIAITDHDTLAGIAPTRRAAADALEIISGVEITTEFRGKELHLLGYCFDPSDAALGRALDHLRAERVGRFRAMVERLRLLGVPVEEEAIVQLGDEASLGRRHLAELIVRAKKASSVREAFQRYLDDQGRASVPKTRLPVSDAIGLVRSAGGVASWAHPNYDCTMDSLLELKRVGLGAIEAEYPAFRASRTSALRALARQLGLAITGGSDCHGPGNRAVGACSISHDELLRLRDMI
ncbi:MAG: PHP domain-containing protein [Planctomycetes bacterium]|nr:PHP domain-containing protein [Planctomycetota bacterium]